MEPPKYVEGLLIAFLFLLGLYFWTQPVSDIPYGEVDAASHYALAEYTAFQDKSIITLPYYIDLRYGRDNAYQEHTLWYPPPFHTLLATAAIFGNKNIYLMNSLLCLLTVLSVYLLLRKLFGFEVAFFSSLLLVFSLRDILITLWGQWPERLGFAYVPLVLYCFYQYVTTKRNQYVYLLSALLAVNLYMHPMTFFHSLAVLGIASIFLLIKYKKPFWEWKPVMYAGLLFIVLSFAFPLQTANVLFRAGDANTEHIGEFGRLFHWYEAPLQDEGVPLTYYSSSMIGPWWALLLIVAGILFLLLKRDERSLMLLAWLVGLYIMIHLDVFGMGRPHRSLSETAHLFYPLFVLGVFFLATLIPQLKEHRFWVGLGATALLLLFIAPPAISALLHTYEGVGRVNADQLEFISWAKNNLAESDSIKHVGSLSLAKTRWIWMMSHHYAVPSNIEANTTHLLIDYSDFSRIGNVQALQQLQAFEESINASTLSYQGQLMRMYDAT